MRYFYNRNSSQNKKRFQILPLSSVWLWVLVFVCAHSACYSHSHIVVHFRFDAALLGILSLLFTLNVQLSAFIFHIHISIAQFFFLLLLANVLFRSACSKRCETLCSACQSKYTAKYNCWILFTDNTLSKIVMILF